MSENLEEIKKNPLAHFKFDTLFSGIKILSDFKKKTLISLKLTSKIPLPFSMFLTSMFLTEL